MQRKVPLENILKVLTLAGAVIGFGIGLWQWTIKEHQSAVSRRLEATKPFLQRQLKLYTEASQIAAKIATHGLAETSGDVQTRFWELFWGELALVENKSVESAMIDMGNAIEDKCEGDYLEQTSLKLSHAMRASLDKSWGIDAWVNPDNASSPQPQPRDPLDVSAPSGAKTRTDQADTPKKLLRRSKMKCGKLVDQPPSPLTPATKD
jgi:hypothetical protein